MLLEGRLPSASPFKSSSSYIQKLDCNMVKQQILQVVLHSQNLPRDFLPFRGCRGPQTSGVSASRELRRQQKQNWFSGGPVQDCGKHKSNGLVSYKWPDQPFLKYFQARIRMNVEKNGEISTKLCVNCNKFYGNETQSWLCSSCFKNHPQKKTSIEVPRVEITSPTEVPSPNPIEPECAPKQADPTRCFKCNKKVGLLGVNCKCTLVFCNLHRLPQQHACCVDYKKLGREKLSEQIKKVAPSKITQI